MDFNELELFKHVLVPKGIYRAKVIDTGEEIVGVNSKQLIIEFEIQDAPYKGTIVRARITLSSAKAKLFFNHILNCLGLDPMKIKSSQEMHGMECLIEVDVNPDSHDNVIRNYHPLD